MSSAINEKGQAFGGIGLTQMKEISLQT